MLQGSPAIEADTFLKAGAALLSAAFGAIVFASGPRRPVHWYLSLFFLLIAGNQAAETVRSLSVAPDGEGSFTPYRIAHVFSSLDPFALYYFASIFPARNQLNRPVWTGLVLTTSGVFAGLSWVTGPPVSAHPWWVAENAGREVFTGIVYTVVLLAVLRALLRDPARPAYRLLYPALCFAALPVWNFGVASVAGVWDIFGDPPFDARSVLLGIVPALLVAGGLIARTWRATRPEAEVRRLVARATVGGAVIATVLNVGVLYAGLFDSGPFVDQVTSILGNGSASVRWLLFGSFVSMGILRYEMLGMSLRARRRAARVLVALGFLLVGSFGVALSRLAFGVAASGVPTFDIAFLVLVLVASQGFRQVIDRVATAVYGVPMPGDAAAAIEAYRLAAVEAAHRGGTDPAGGELVRLREELGLDRRTSDVFERMAQTVTWGPLAPGQAVAGRYRIQKLLGRGGSGRAFLARDELLLRDVVIKEVLHDDDAGRAHALREARAAGSLQHPHVVTLYDVHQRPDASLLVTEYVAGGSLSDRLASQGPLPADDGLRILEDVLDGLAAVHEQGVVHRDLKPANVFLTPDGRAKIGDFGIAWVAQSATAHAGSMQAFQGTPEFMAPEQRRGESATPATDLYAVGLMARKCLETDAGDRVHEVIDRALSDQPGMRWRSAGDMQASLRAARRATNGT